MRNDSLPQSVRDMVDQYLNLKVNGISIQTPYFMNIKKQRAGLRVMIGKGTPEEIIQETQIYAKLKGINLEKVAESSLRKFMTKVGIGVDCSGFIVHLLETWLQSQHKKHLWDYLIFPKQSPYRRLVRFFRPIENISAFQLTNDENTEEIETVDQVQTGDLIRLKDIKDGYHVAMITDISCNEQGEVTSVKYVHSTKYYDDKHGVRIGGIEIADPKGSLLDQRFTDSYSGKNWFLEELKSDPEYSGVRRLKHVPLYS